MRSSPRKLSTETDLYTAAINGLARRAYSVYEMRTYLERRAEDKDVVKGVLDRLKQTGLSGRRALRAPICPPAHRIAKAGAVSHRARSPRPRRARPPHRSSPCRALRRIERERPRAGAPGAPHQDAARPARRTARRFALSQLAPRRIFRGHNSPRIERVEQSRPMEELPESPGEEA